MNILIVDDETILLASLSIGLESRGYKVLTASSSKEALEILNNDHNKFDLIITDYVMPGMDGMELLRKIREGNSTLPIIIMTAYGEKDLVVDALGNCCDGFIKKPFSLERLIKEIEMTSNSQLIIQRKEGRNARISRNNGPGSEGYAAKGGKISHLHLSRRGVRDRHPEDQGDHRDDADNNCSPDT